MLGVGGAQADNRFTLAGAIIGVTGVAMALLNKRKSSDNA
jgi:hypothetical protein